jgi:predicted CoA-binding protein
VDAVVMPLASELAPRVLSATQVAEAAARRRAGLEGAEALFDPQSIAFIGASTVTTKLGYRSIRNLLDFGFHGPIYPIHPKARTICDLPAYPSILDVPAQVDRAYIALGAAQVPDALRQCREKGVKVVQVLTAGFSEWSAGDGPSKGEALEREIAAVLADGSMRMVGPNCIGTFSAAHNIARRPRAGSASFLKAAPSRATWCVAPRCKAFPWHGYSLAATAVTSTWWISCCSAQRIRPLH